MALDPTRRSPRLLAVMAAVVLLPFLGACGDGDDDDDDDDDDRDDGMRAAAVLVLPN